MTPASKMPLRQLARLRTEMAIGAHQSTCAIFPGEPALGIEFGIVALRCLPDWIDADRITCPVDGGTRAITVRQIARSLGIPAETARRHVIRLRERGAVTMRAGGVALETDPANAALVERFLLGVHDLLVRLIEDVTLTSDLILPVGQHARAGIGAVIERAIEVLLLPVDTFRLAGQQHAILLWGALTAVAVRGVTYDPVLARRYAQDMPPDALRASISLRKLADALAIPYASAWRQMQSLHERGLVTRLGADRWTVLRENLLVDSALAVGAPPSIFMLRKLRELTLLGFDPAGAASRYRVGRPDRPFLGGTGDHQG